MPYFSNNFEVSSSVPDNSFRISFPLVLLDVAVASHTKSASLLVAAFLSETGYGLTGVAILVILVNISLLCVVAVVRG